MNLPVAEQGRSPSVLIVEDDRPIGPILKFVKERQGDLTEPVVDGQVENTFVDRCSSPPDLILLGVMLTAKIMGQDSARALDAGTNDDVVKPFQPKEPLVRVRRFLKAGMRGGSAFVLLAAMSPALHGADTATLARGFESLSNGSQPWRETSLQFAHGLAPRHSIDGGIVQTERFGLDDTAVQASYTRPLSDDLTGLVDVQASPSHRVVARNAVGGSLQYRFASGWLVHAGAKSARYDAVRVNQALLMLENYVGNFSWSIAWRPARAFSDTAQSGELRGSYYYGDKNAIALIVAGGEETANLGSRVVIANIQSTVLTGHHWFDQRWALTYSVGTTRQGSSYRRNGMSVGVQHAF